MPGYSVLHGMARAAKSLVFALGPEVGSAVLENTLSVLVTPGHSASNKKGPRKGPEPTGLKEIDQTFGDTGGVRADFARLKGIEPMSSVFKSSLAVAVMLGFATTAYAATGEFSNQCSWGLANHQHVQTDCTISSPYRGRTYCFGSQEAQTNFMKHPHRNLAKAEAFYKSEHKG